MQISGSANGVANASMVQALEDLQNILLELDTKLDEGGTINLSPGTISQLQTVTATILNQPTDFPDAAGTAKLTSILAALQAALSVIVSNFPTDYPSAQTHTDLSDALIKLDSILGELGDIDTLLAGTLTVAGTVAVSNFPGTQPVSAASLPLPSGAATETTLTGASTKLDTLHTDNGSATTSPPTSGVGIIGWLRGIYDRLSTLTVTTTPPNHASTDVDQIAGAAIAANSGNKDAGTQRVVLATDQPALSNALKIDGSAVTQPISATTLPLPTGAAADSSLGTLHTDLGHLTDNTQLTRITNGTQTADTVAGDSGQNSLVTTAARKEVIYSSTGVNSAVVDVSNYRWGSVQIISIGTTLTSAVQWSNDGATWLALPSITANQVGAAPSAGASFTAAGNNAVFPLPGRYFRYNVSAQTGAAPSVYLEFFASPPPFAAYPGIASQLGTFTVAQGSASASAVWPVGGPLAATSLNAVTTASTGASKAYGSTMAHHTLQIVVGGTGSLSALTVILEGSNDGGTNWVTIATYSNATSGGISQANTPYQTVRARASVLTAASGTPTVTGIVAACA